MQAGAGTATSGGGALEPFDARTAVYAFALFLFAGGVTVALGWEQWALALVKLWVAYCIAHAAILVLKARRGSHPPLWSCLLVACIGSLLGAALVTLPGIAYPVRLYTGARWWVYEVWTCAVFSFVVAISRMLAARRQWQRETRRINLQSLRDERSEALRRSLADRLQLLQAQIEPHFLYNTLANVQQLVKVDTVQADRMLSALIRYLRESLPKLRDTSSTLAREFELTAAYLDIARIRFRERLDVSLELPESLRELPFPPMVLQTLAENAVKHGAEPKVGPVQVSLRAWRDGDDTFVAVVDDGVGLDPEAPIGTGLRNVRERLSAIYADAANLELSANEPSGLVAAVRLKAKP